MSRPDMNVLFVHQNFPGQYRHLAPALAALPGHQVRALRIGKDDASWQGVKVSSYAVSPESVTPGGHPWLADMQTKLVRAEAAARAAAQLKADGFVPDVIVAHPGWGETLLLPEVWPRARIGLFCEFYYRGDGADVGFDPEFSKAADELAEAGRLRAKNINHLLSFEDAVAGISPTEWQRSLYPERMHERINVVHDGIDTRALRPNPGISMSLNKGLRLTREDEVITFVNRNLEPYRGYHVFMRALPELLRRRPKARVILVGGDGVSYGAAPSGPGQVGKTWRQIFLDEVKDELDMRRVHFVGKLPYADFVQLLQLSRVHVYLTYPFVLSWSLMESMSIGCAIVASDTAPVREVIADREHGLLVDFFDGQSLVERCCELLDDPALAARLGKAARERVVERYDLTTRCLPAQLEWVERVRG
jgi:glycosyltransferase involved in cell wall biosynthesis